MRLGRGLIRWVLTPLAAFAVGVATFSILGGDGGGEDGVPAGPMPAQIQSAPSDLAREAIPRPLLELYQRTGEELELDWSVIAAIDQMQGTAGPAEDEERVSAIAYALEAHGAPESYVLAAEAYGGGARYARAALRLADRYREVEDVTVPRTEGQLRMPTRGPVVATYGRQFGVLHDGIDIDAPTGRPIRAAADGLVVSTGAHSVFGQYTCVLHRFAPPLDGERRLTTCYGNQSQIATEPGAQVEQGDVIGYVGCTGTCLRPGLHFQVRLGSGPSAPVADPARFLDEPVRAGRERPVEVPAGAEGLSGPNR
jgi:murein DD-endopeptidase MepM/ murein hydrolase activator NlpD